jgi:hypothetical protein
VRRQLVGPLVVALVVVGTQVYRARTGTDEAVVRKGRTALADAVVAPLDTRLSVTGYVFIDRSTGDLLCSERTKGDHPACKGLVAELERLDPTRLDLVRAPAGEKGYDAWSREQVVLQVRARGGTFVVEDVLR